MSKIPKTLKEALLNKKVVPFVGAGVSMSVKDKNTRNPLFPSWKEFVESLVNRLEDDNFEADAAFVKAAINLPEPKYLTAIEHAKNELKTVWFDCLLTSFNPNRNKVDENSLNLAKLIWKISNNLIITTNVDKVLEWSCSETPDIFDGQKEEFVELAKTQYQPETPTVLHLHGYIRNKEKVIFTETQFRNFYENSENQAKLQALQNVLTGRTLLFIGYSLGDEYFKKQLSHIHDIYKGGAGSYYILLHNKYKGNKDIPRFVTPIFVDDYEVDLIETIKEMAEIETDKDKFRRVMDGLWEYSCKVNGDDTFDGKDVERGGVMNFKVVDQPLSFFGFDIQIDARRIWSKEKDKKENILEKGLPWHAEGSFAMSSDGKTYTFGYTFKDIKTNGVTTDTYLLDSDGIKIGTFEHTQEHPEDTPKKYKVTGVVKARKMTDENDLQWLPSGVKYSP